MAINSQSKQIQHLIEVGLEDNAVTELKNGIEQLLHQGPFRNQQPMKRTSGSRILGRGHWLLFKASLSDKIARASSAWAPNGRIYGAGEPGLGPVSLTWI
jgi:hypothetical protein